MEETRHDDWGCIPCREQEEAQQAAAIDFWEEDYDPAPEHTANYEGQPWWAHYFQEPEDEEDGNG
jgi:hypothetical protein